MREYVNRCGRIARMFSIGSSVEGRPLWALEISETPGKVEPKPNARVIGNMHGDEPASRCVVTTACLVHLFAFVLDLWCMCAHWVQAGVASTIAIDTYEFTINTSTSCLCFLASCKIAQATLGQLTSCNTCRLSLTM